MAGTKQRKALIFLGANAGELGKDLEKAKRTVKKAAFKMKQEQQKAAKATSALRGEVALLAQQAGVLGGAPVAAVSKLGLAFTAVGTGVNTGSKALKLFRLALISTGIGALIVVVGSAIAYFSRFESGIRLANTAMNVVKTTVGRLIDAFGSLGGLITAVFSGDLGEISAAWKKAKETFASIGEGISEGVALATAENLSKDLENAFLEAKLSTTTQKGIVERLTSRLKTQIDTGAATKDIAATEASLSRALKNFERKTEEQRRAHKKFLKAEIDRIDKSLAQTETSTAEANEALKEKTQLTEQLNRLQKKSLATQEAAITQIKAANARLQKTAKEVEMPIKITAPPAVQQELREQLDNEVAKTEELVLEHAEKTAALGPILKDAYEEVAGGLSSGVGSFVASLFDSDRSMRSRLAEFGKTIQSLGQSMVAMGTARLAFNALKKAGPLGIKAAIAAGVVVIGIGAALSAKMKKASRESSGLTGAGANIGSSVGTGGGAAVSSSPHTAPGFNQNLQIEVFGTLIGRGADLLAVIKNVDRTNNISGVNPENLR